MAGNVCGGLCVWDLPQLVLVLVVQCAACDEWADGAGGVLRDGVGRSERGCAWVGSLPGRLVAFPPVCVLVCLDLSGLAVCLGAYLFDLYVSTC